MCKVNCYSKALHIAALPKVRGAACHVPCFSQGFHSRQPTLSCSPLRSVVIHCTSLRYIRSHRTRSLRLGHDQYTTQSHGLNLHSLPTQGSLHFIPFRSFPLSLSRLQSTGCPCCARLRCRPGCGLSCFLHPFLLATARPIAFNNPSCEAKNHASPCSVQPLPDNPTAHSPRLSSWLAPAFTSFFRSCSLLTPYLLLAGFTSLRSVHPWAARIVMKSHRTSDAQSGQPLNSRCVLYCGEYR
jgi:hypothetical protein